MNKFTKICPKCKSTLREKTYLYTGNSYQIEKKDVTNIGSTQKELWFYGGSGVVYKNKKSNIVDFLKHSTGIGVIENVLECSKCGYSQDVDYRR